MPINRAAGGAPVGAVEFFAMNAAPTGWLKANGATLTRTAYPALWLAVNPATGGAGGAGNGSTTFTVPDLRGEFPRGWDDGRAVDTGRGIGSAQAHQMQSHTHSVTSYTQNAGGTNGIWHTEGNTPTTRTTTAAGATTNASENRPRNVALLACIKF